MQKKGCTGDLSFLGVAATHEVVQADTIAIRQAHQRLHVGLVASDFVPGQGNHVEAGFLCHLLLLQSPGLADSLQTLRHVFLALRSGSGIAGYGVVVRPDAVQHQADGFAYRDGLVRPQALRLAELVAQRLSESFKKQKLSWFNRSREFVTLTFVLNEKIDHECVKIIKALHDKDREKDKEKLRPILSYYIINNHIYHEV